MQLICTFVFRICIKQAFSHLGSFNILQTNFKVLARTKKQLEAIIYSKNSCYDDSAMSNQIKVTIATNIQSEVAGHSLVNLIKVECPPLLPIGWIDAVVPYDWLEERLGLNLPGYSLGAYLMESYVLLKVVA